MAAPHFDTADLPGDLKLAYIDSWHARAEEDRPTEYTTVVGLHGVGFNSAVWAPLLPSLPPNIRFLAYNQRSYAGSSPAFEAKEEGGVDATARYLADMMEFLRFAVDKLGVKPVEEGGVVLLGWSKGTTLPIALLSLLHLSTTPPPSFAAHLPNHGDDEGDLPHTALLTSHLRSIPLFEFPGSALGRPPTADLAKAMGPVSPPNKATSEEFADAFAGWIGEYSPPTSSDEPASADLPPSGLAALSPELLAAAWQPECVTHGFAWRLGTTADEVQRLAKQALNPPLSPAVPVGFLYGSRTVGYCIDAAQTVEEWWGVAGGTTAAKEGEGEERRTRKTGVRRIDGTNHFAFLHEPEAFSNAVEELIDELGP